MDGPGRARRLMILGKKTLNSVSGVNSTIVCDDSPLTRIKVENTTGARFRFVAYRQDGIRVDNGIFETNSAEIIALRL